MDDLISRQSVIEMLTEIETNNWFPTFAMLKQMVSDIPTAYDVDKVAAQLERDKFIDSETTLSDVHQGYNAGLSRAIGFVKGGAK